MVIGFAWKYRKYSFTPCKYSNTYVYHTPGYKLAKHLPSIEKFISNKLPSIFAENIMVKAIRVSKT